jgi:hypothetical protein
VVITDDEVRGTLPASGRPDQGEAPDAASRGTEKATDAQVGAWRASGKTYQVIAAEIAVWARGKERGTVLPDDQVFGRQLNIDTSPSTYRRAKMFLVAQGVLSTSDGPFQVA